MSSPYLGEIRMFAGTFAPVGWLMCDGSILPISDYDALFQLIGTTYGGDGQSTFALPDLRGRMPVHMGTNAGTTFTVGEAAGVETVTLTPDQMPAHSHAPLAAASAITASASNTVFAGWPDTPYATPGTTVPMAATVLEPAGGGHEHDNMPPYRVVNFIISLSGTFPSPS
jgi:microcystin-dependent protein